MNIEFKGLGDTFHSDIEILVSNNGLSYIEAIIHWCEKKNIEVDLVTSMVSSNMGMKNKLQLEAEKLNFIPKSIRLQL